MATSEGLPFFGVRTLPRWPISQVMETERGYAVATQLKIINWPAFLSEAVPENSFRVRKTVIRSLGRRLFGARRLMRVSGGLIKRGGPVISNTGNHGQTVTFFFNNWCGRVRRRRCIGDRLL